MLATFLPVFVLPNLTWQSFMTLTLIGQYIFKNLVMLAAGGFVYSLSKGERNSTVSLAAVHEQRTEEVTL